MEADNSAYRINRYGYSYHSWSDELHDLRIGGTGMLIHFIPVPLNHLKTTN